MGAYDHKNASIAVKKAIELAVGSLLSDIDVKTADPKLYGKSALLHLFVLTDFGGSGPPK